MKLKTVLIVTGIFFILLGILGFVRVLGPTSQESIFGELWWLDKTENWSHLVVGLVSVIFGLFAQDSGKKIWGWLYGILLVVVSIYSIITSHLLKVNLEVPVEEVLYFTIGDIVLWATVNSNKAKKEILHPSAIRQVQADSERNRMGQMH